MPNDTDFEWTDDATRTEAAALLRDLADGVEAGEVALDDADRTVTAAIPEGVTVELEFEADDEASELEVELEWRDAERPGDGRPDESAADDRESDEPDAGDAAGPDADEEPSLPEILTADEGPSGSLATFEVYRDRADEWRWRLRHRNGNIIADSGEGYGRRATAVNGLRSVQHNAPGADVDVEE